MSIIEAHCILVLMGRTPDIPAALTRGPFTLDDARREGLDKWHLEGRSWNRIGPATYIWAGLAKDPMQRLEAAMLRIPTNAAFSGLTAAWLHGIDVEPLSPIEVTVPQDAGVSARTGMSVRRAALPKGEVANVRGMRATCLARTIAELSGRLSLTESVVIADMALHSGCVSLEELRAWAITHGRRAGIANFRRVVNHAEPKAESPMESRLRMVLVLGGLPRPEAQVAIHDRWRRFVGRPDLYYRAHRFGIEYDGGVHRDSLAEDNRRQNRLLTAGVRLLRFTAGDVLNQPSSVVEQVRTQITAAAGSDGIRVA